MLESIAMKEVATFDEEGIEIEDLKKVNFIYGANGIGKTTITKFLDHPEDEQFNECYCTWKNDTPLAVRTYNKEFRDKNFGKGSIDGVFTLGKATKEEQEAIEKLKVDLSGIKDQKNQKAETIGKLKEEMNEREEEANETFWKIYKKYESQFKEAFAGSIRSKEAFKLILLQEFSNNKSALLSIDELSKHAKTIFGKIPELMAFLPGIESDKGLPEIEENPIWQKKIIGKTDISIGILIQQLNINDWVNEGRKYIKEGDDTCPFCQEATITDRFKSQLENYFDESFTRDTGIVNGLSEKYIQGTETLINKLQLLETNERNNSESKLDVDLFSAVLKTLQSQVIANRELLRGKTKEPSRSMKLTSIREQFEKLEGLIQQANESVKDHNRIVTNYSEERKKLVKSVWKYVAEENKEMIELYLMEINGKKKGIVSLEQQHGNLEGRCRELELEIREKTKNVTSVQPSIDKINLILKSYGCLNFEIVSSPTNKNQYQIQREDGTIAESTLSEGEVTFITFLYFLQLCEGSRREDKVTIDRILVVDDPISSLDSNILFVVSSLLKAIIKDIKAGKGSIKQLVLLTHNVYFHKEVSYDSKGLTNKDTNYWILRKIKKVSSVESFGMKNPIQNSYELLWRELESKANSSIVNVQNVMRRIIENYFKIMGNCDYDDLIQSFGSQEEQEICRSLICWINDGSHCFPDDLFVEHQESLIDKYKKVFKGIFINMGHEAHYKMMIGKEVEVVLEEEV